jgi:hypothetical protein
MSRRTVGFVVASVALWVGAGNTLGGQGINPWETRARQRALAGDAGQARQELERAVADHPNDASALMALARFLDERRDLGASAAFEKLAGASQATAQERDAALRRLAALDLIAGNRTAAERHLARMSSPLTLPPPGAATRLPMGKITIPGPLAGFSRMAALSPDLPPEEIVPALARNVVTNGYQAVGGTEGLEQTEYLKLVVRYLSQARELEKFAGDSKVIRIEACDSPRTGELLKILGFRMRGGCGGEVVLETVNASRAFLTIDSGFPLAELEQALRTNRVFNLDYRPTSIAILYGPEYWLSAREKQSGEAIDAFVNDPLLCRLYLGLVKLDPETAEEIRKAMPVERVRAFAHVFDFFGGMLRLTNGHAVVPGGDRSQAAWADLVGVTPAKGVEFIEKLVMKDDGWMASYFDSLSRISGPTQDYLTEPERLKRFYAALRGKVTSPGPARPVFRANTDLMLLATRLRIDPDGKPHIPGSLEVWKNLFVRHPQGKYDGRLTKSAAGWKGADDLIEALFGLSRKAVENEPLRIFLCMSDLDRGRTHPLEATTVERLARSWRNYGAQYSIFSEVPTLNDSTILHYLETAEAIEDMRDNMQRADTAGITQALVGIWQVLCRQDLIPPRQADATLDALLPPLARVKNTRDLFDAGRTGVETLLKATGTAPDANPQDRLIDLLAGAAQTKDQETLDRVRGDMLRLFEAQKLVSLKVIFDLADHLESLSRGERMNTALLNRLAARVSDLNLPKASLTTSEKNALSFGYWTERHVDAQRKLNFRAVIDKTGGNAERLKEARGLLTPLLRDTLVGFLYVHYSPPGAQLILTNPLFVRSHDFIGIQSSRQTWKQTEVFGSGWPASAGGRLVGSLVTLPYALAEAEQNFLIPTREQALIWGDLVPQMLVSSKLPRWWRVTPGQLHWVNLHLRLGEAVVAEVPLSAEARNLTQSLLDRLAPPARVKRVLAHLAGAEVHAALDEITPAELYQLGREAAARKLTVAGGFAAEIDEMAAADPARINERAIGEAFGTPKPTLATTLHPLLLNLRTFPTLMGYSSRILAESWESNNLFFAGLADELSLRPSQLNVLIPEWTQRTVEQIFATHLEDWPALLRSMRTIADNVRAETRKARSLEQKAALE